MPIYEYKCAECGRRFEVLQRMSDPPPAACESCGGALTRVVSAPAFQFKGSGWYVTDYGGRKGGAEEGSAESAGSADASEKSPGGTAGSEKGSAKSGATAAKGSEAKAAAGAKKSGPAGD